MGHRREIIKEIKWPLNNGQFVMTEEGIMKGPQTLTVRELPGSILVVEGVEMSNSFVTELTFAGSIIDFSSLVLS